MDIYGHFNPTFNLKIALNLLCLCLASVHLQTSKLFFADGLTNTVKLCIDEERVALVSFKQGLTDPSGKLSSWSGQDCCQWEGILGNNLTGHVAKMDLRNTYVTDPQMAYGLEYEESCLGGEVNPSLLTLKHLNYLDLSWNDFKGIRIPNFFGELKTLRYLNISSSSFGGEIPPSLGNLSNLNFLDLSARPYYSSLLEIPSENLNWLSRLSSLQYLNLGRLSLANTGVSWLHVINMFPSLLELHLSSCEIGNLPQITLKTLNFTSLLALDMSSNFISSFPSWLFNLTVLTKLHLRQNSLSGPIPYELSSLKSIQELDLSGNRLEGQVPKLIGNLCELKTLNLESNKFVVGIQELLSGFLDCRNSRLESLNLYSNRLESQLPASLGMLQYLQYLNLGSNIFSGSFPESIANLSSLKILDLSYNLMNGSMPERLGQLSELLVLKLSGNSWEGTLTEAHLINLTRLQHIAVGPDRPILSLTFGIAYEWVPPFKLQVIEIINCQVGPKFSMWLRSQTNLTEITLLNTGISDSLPEEWLLKLSPQVSILDLSHNQIRGTLPLQLEFPNVQSLDLSYNQLEGSLPHWSSTGASVLDLRSNLFSGPIPSSYDELFPYLEELYLSENHLSGSIPPSICNMENLAILSLWSNRFSGEFPHAWMEESNIMVVDVANNNLSGNIPISLGVLRSLSILKLSNNTFEGKIPRSLQNCSLLMSIDLGGNRLTGSIPLWNGSNIADLFMLRLRSNFLSGHLPQQLCYLPSLHILDLGHNNFSGTIPKCLKNMTSLVYGNSTVAYSDYPERAKVMSKGRELEYKDNVVFLVNNIDLSSNNLEGEIPQELTSLAALGILNLSMNQLSGKIPSNIGNLRWLETLDLSRNHLSGQIPQSLSSLTFLSHLNLSYNNLVGKIPSGNQLQTLIDPSIYKGNPLLCGVPLAKCPGDDSAPTFPSDGEEGNEDGNNKDVFWFYVSMGLGFFVGFWDVCGTLLVKDSWSYAYFQFFDEIKDKAVQVIATKLACGK